MAKEHKMEKRETIGLLITNFVQDYSLKEAGAMIGDVIIKYNGQPVKSVEELQKYKEKCKKKEVKITVLRDEEEIELTISKGQLGAYLSVLMPPHEVKKNAVILEGYGKLAWGIGMENTFLGAVYRIQEKLGEKISYTDLVGLSGYGFRVQFFDNWCPSSPDATVGKDIGSAILDILGYDYEIYALENEFSEEDGPNVKSQSEMKEIITSNIDDGYPIIANDMIDVPEWGIVTGYQSNGDELLCRTYYDKTQSYEIAQKFPWVIYVIKDYNPQNYRDAYKESIILAKNMYNTEKYCDYFSGIKAIEEWIIDLKDADYIKNASEKKHSEIILANWWIYYSLMEARAYAEKYLINNINKFDTDEETVREIAKLYKNEVEIFGKGFNDLPFPHQPELPEWTSEQRKNEIDTLQNILSYEKRVKEILNNKL